MVQIIRRSNRLWISISFAVTLCFAIGAAAQVSQDLFSGLQWRNVGPFHGGRIAAVTGVIGEPGTFYVGLPQGGIWKTTSGGMTWYPVFDQVTEVDSIGAIQVAPSDRNIIYAGSGDAVAGGNTGTNGVGMYKSIRCRKNLDAYRSRRHHQDSEDCCRPQRSQYRDRRRDGRDHWHATRHFPHRRRRPDLDQHLAPRQ